MVEGKLRKQLAEITLYGQEFAAPENKDRATVEKILKTAGAEVTGLTRYAVGQGIEKQQGDFGAEVMAMVKGPH
jgi:elongation factor Ts